MVYGFLSGCYDNICHSLSSRVHGCLLLLHILQFWSITEAYHWNKMPILWRPNVLQANCYFVKNSTKIHNIKWCILFGNWKWKNPSNKLIITGRPKIRISWIKLIICIHILFIISMHTNPIYSYNENQYIYKFI